MRVAVIGAGAVGGAMAALLDRAGHEVEVTARGAHLAAIQEHGIRLGGAWGEHTARVAGAELLQRAPELVIVATKAQDAPAAIGDNAELLAGVPVLIVQNGLEQLEGAAPLLPKSDLVGALALFASSFLSPGTITVTTAGPTFVGGASAETDVPARFVASVLGAVMPVTYVADFRGAQWTKLVVNQINALPAITGLSAQEVISDPGLRRILTASIRENARIGLASGVRFAGLQGLSHGLLRAVAALPLWCGQVVPLAMRRRMGPTPNPGSTLQSIRRGQRSEIDYLNGAVVHAAAQLGREAPVNATLVDLVHEVERDGRFFAPAEVKARVAV